MMRAGSLPRFPNPGLGCRHNAILRSLHHPHQPSCGRVNSQHKQRLSLAGHAQGTNRNAVLERTRPDTRPTQQPQRASSSQLFRASIAEYSQQYSAQTLRFMRQLTLAQSRPKANLGTDSADASLSGIQLLQHLAVSPAQPELSSAALALLCEAGRFEESMGIGNRLLGTGKLPQAAAQDIALTVALSYLSHSDEGSEPVSVVQQSYRQLELAIQVLSKHDACPGLRLQLETMLQSVAASYAAELFAGAKASQGTTTTSQHSKACSVLRSALWRAEGAQQRVELLASVRGMLTAAEQIGLYSGAPKDVQLNDQELYDIAMAHIAQGVTTCWPHHIMQAHSFLERVQQGSPEINVSHELAVCEVLVGRQTEAERQLQDDEVMEFQEFPDPDGVMDLPPSDETYSWVQSWLQLSVLPNFPETAGHELSLRKWFTDPKVVVWNKVLRHAVQDPISGFNSLSQRSKQKLWSLWQAASQQMPTPSVTDRLSGLLQQSKAAVLDTGSMASVTGSIDFLTAAETAALERASAGPSAGAPASWRSAYGLKPFLEPVGAATANAAAATAAAFMRAMKRPDVSTAALPDGSAGAPAIAELAPGSAGVLQGEARQPPTVSQSPLQQLSSLFSSVKPDISNILPFNRPPSAPIPAVADVQPVPVQPPPSRPDTQAEPDTSAAVAAVLGSYADLSDLPMSSMEGWDIPMPPGLWHEDSSGHIRPRAALRLVGGKAAAASSTMSTGPSENGTLVKAVRTAAVVGVIAAVAIQMLQRSVHNPKAYASSTAPSSLPIATGMAVASSDYQYLLQDWARIQEQAAAVGSIDLSSATQLLSCSQRMRAAAFGPSHQHQLLQHTCQGVELQKETAEALRYQGMGRHLRFTTLCTTVHSVQPAQISVRRQKAPEIWVATSIEEAGQVYEGDMAVEDFGAAYNAQYKLQLGKDNTWRIVQVLQGSSAGPLM